MDYLNLAERVIHLNDLSERAEVERFLAGQNLVLDKDVEYTIALTKNDLIMAAGSISGRVIKCLAVSPDYQGMGLTGRIVSRLIDEAYRRGRSHLFVYTQPDNYTFFTQLGFNEIARIPEVLLLENKSDGIDKYLEEIAREKRSGKIVSALVVNCNPFTLGHRYVIEKAAVESDVVHVFVVWEDFSAFPRDIRYRLIKEGTADLSNVILHRGRDYIISSATFPSYFLKEKSLLVETHALLDLKIFCSRIAPALGINRRYVGEEPYCPVTSTYNAIMKRVLPAEGIQVIEIPRLQEGARAISASRVRELVRMGKISETRQLVPESTYKYLVSEEAVSLIAKIQTGETRH